MHTTTAKPIVYVVSVREIAFSGERAAPFETTFTGRGAYTRAIRFAENERRSSTSTIEVYPVGGKRRGNVWSYRNPRAVCPCNDPRCLSPWAAGRILSSLEIEPLLDVARHEAERRTPAVCQQPAPRCSGDASWQWVPGERVVYRVLLPQHAGACSARVTAVPSRDGWR